MRTSLRVGVLVVLVSGGARGEEVRTRGPASTVGLSLLALGVGGAGLGIAGLVSMSEAQRILGSYTKDGAPITSDALASEKLEQRTSDGTTLAAIGWAVAGVGLAGGLILLLADAPRAVRLGLVPVPGGGLISYSLSW